MLHRHFVLNVLLDFFLALRFCLTKEFGKKIIITWSTAYHKLYYINDQTKITQKMKAFSAQWDNVQSYKQLY